MQINSLAGGTDQFILALISDLYGWGKSFIQKITMPGMYEVVNYETTLEILDAKGKAAILTKIEEVRFLQNNIIAFQDQAWGDGKILKDYHAYLVYRLIFTGLGTKRISLSHSGM
jgi:hypothetical protein